MAHLHHAALESFGSVFLTLILVFTALVYLWVWLALRSGRVTRISAWGAVSFLVGLFLIWVAMASAVAALDHELLTVHMLQHLLLMTFAPPLIWLGAPVGPILRGLPQCFAENLLVPFWQSRAVKRIAERLGRPKFAWLAVSAALIGWHVPKLFAFGMQSVGWHLFEQLSFLGTGLLFWRPIVQSSAGAGPQDLSLIVYLFFATLPCDILSGFLVFCDRVVYPMYFSSSHLLGLSALADQECAAALMWTSVTVVYFVAGAILNIRLLSPQAGLEQPKLRERRIGHRVSLRLEAV
jgi:cytochrome c oxidase assembly factor CtaG